MKHQKIIWLWIALLFSGVLVGNLTYKYYQYKNFISHTQFISAKIINQYKKKNYWVLKIKNNDITFYTTTKDDLKDILNREIEIKLITKKLTFWKYITTFYAPSYSLGILEKKDYNNFIEKQHKNKKISNIFEALFFGDSLYYDTRQKLSSLGISHLFALSGLHLAIISGILYLLLTPIYRLIIPPYRNKNIDLGIFILTILFIYLYFVNFPPSLVRSFIMEILVFIFAFYLRDIFSFKLLALAVIVGIVLFPNFLVSIGFFLSVMGVFLIFLFFKYVKLNYINGLIILPIYLYITMLPISHYFFGNFNYYQLMSPFVSIIFNIFYPIEIFLHLIGEGGVFDKVIESYFNLGDKYITFYTPSFLFYGYLIILVYLASKPLYNQNHYKQLE